MQLKVPKKKVENCGVLYTYTITLKLFGFIMGKPRGKKVKTDGRCFQK